MSEILKADDIYKTYKSRSGEVNALRGISVSFQEKLCYAIIGKSGSGKSTLLHVLGCLNQPDAGRVTFAGQDIYRWKDREQAIFRRRHMGFVFQQFNLVPEYTVRQNITLPLQLDGKRPDDEFYREIVELLHISDKGAKYPWELSGGEQQRVAIARAIAHRPGAVIADEPTAQLDSTMGLQVMAVFKKLIESQGTTVILTTHDPDLLEIADRVFTLKDGMLVPEEGRKGE